MKFKREFKNVQKWKKEYFWEVFDNVWERKKRKGNKKETMQSQHWKKVDNQWQVCHIPRQFTLNLIKIIEFQRKYHPCAAITFIHQLLTIEPGSLDLSPSLPGLCVISQSYDKTRTLLSKQPVIYLRECVECLYAILSISLQGRQ